MGSDTLGATIRRLREAKGWSQRDLAAKALVTGAYIAMLETGAKGRASVPVLRRIERALGTPYGRLTGRAHLPREWWRAEAERDWHEAAPPRGPYFATRAEAETEARRQGVPFVVRYQDKPGAVIRRAFPVKSGPSAK
jgi:transcriptional regulator with XRE-family HTH domain